MLEQVGHWRHLCIDMQRMFLEETPWHVPWMGRILPQVASLARACPEKTIFTRFMPPANADQARGAWRDYYRKWEAMTLEAMGTGPTELVPELAALCPPARVMSKPVYSPWVDGRLHAHLQGEGVDTLVMTGGETDVCVMAAVFGAIDLGYRIILMEDGLCSSADQTHDAAVKLLSDRFSMQLQSASVEEFLDVARPGAS